MGIHADLTQLFSFQYRAELDNELVENELDHVFIGFSNTLPKPNAAEVNDFRYVEIEALDREMNENPERFTEWFKLLVPKVKEKL